MRSRCRLHASGALPAEPVGPPFRAPRAPGQPRLGRCSLSRAKRVDRRNSGAARLARAEHAGMQPRSSGAHRSTARPVARDTTRWVNDVHSRLNPTRVLRIERPASPAALARLVRRAAARGEALSISGGRHAMGGQAFSAGGVLVDTSGLDRVLGLDRERGTVDVEAGITWPALVALADRRPGRARRDMGDPPEADRRRPLEPRRSAGGQHPRARPALAALRGGHRELRADRSGR